MFKEKWFTETEKLSKNFKESTKSKYLILSQFWSYFCGFLKSLKLILDKKEIILNLLITFMQYFELITVHKNHKLNKVNNPGYDPKVQIKKN